MNPLACMMVLLTMIMVASCTDDINVNNGGGGSGLPDFDLENKLAVPLSISLGEVGTRDGEQTTLDDDDPGFENGTALEHLIDFDIDKECFALFFNDNEEFMYLRRLYKNPALGNGEVPKDGIGEYQVYALAYIDKPDGYDEMEWEQQKTYLPAKLLVVLNGGRIYDNLAEKFFIDSATGDRKEGATQIFEADDFLEYHWQYDLGNAYNEDDISDSRRLVVIGTNSDGHFTMTNSAYYGPDDENDTETGESDYTLQTVRPIIKENIKDALATNIDSKNSAATVYVERMVAKFSAPKFPTGVIGGDDKVIWPSQSAQPVSIYTWNATNKTWMSEDVKWRVHVLGWTINGREKRNFLFKHIRDGWEKGIKNWDRSDWNDPAHRRSYWSIDPHYDYNPDNESAENEERDFYPWQYRGAVDKEHISWFHQNNMNEDRTQIALRYLRFNEVRYWNEDAITISENTFNPYTEQDEYIINKESYLDNRASLLMGPHLLITAEIYLQNGNTVDNEYVSNFTTVDNLYCDRYYRYFKTEADMFRMFVKDINDALRTQHLMSFKFYEWGEEKPGNNTPPTYEATPVGNVQLLFDCELDNSSMSADEKAVYSILTANKEKYHLKEVADVIDELVKDGVKMTMPATVRDGDGRVIPWIPGMVFRNVDEKTKILDVKIKGETEGFTAWTDDMRKSLIFEWFGRVDHYYKGYMYYAADIPHHATNVSIKDTQNKETYYGAVRNHWYTFTVNAINALGTPIDDPNQRIIPGKYKHNDQISVYVQLAGWHLVGDKSLSFGY